MDASAQLRAQIKYELQFTLFHLCEMRRELADAGCPIPSRLQNAIKRIESMMEVLKIEALVQAPKDE